MVGVSTQKGHFPSFLFLVPLFQFFLSQESRGFYYIRSVQKNSPIKTKSDKLPFPLHFLVVLKLTEEHKARSFNLSIHHKPLISHLNNPLISYHLKVTESLFKVYPKTSTFHFYLQGYHQPIDSEKDKMATKIRPSKTQPKFYIQESLMTFR